MFRAFENNVSIEIDGGAQSIGRLGKVQSRPRSVDDPCTGRQSSTNNGIVATPCGLQLHFHALNVSILPPRICGLNPTPGMRPTEMMKTMTNLSSRD
jgi:hypothetical protein